MPDWKIYYGDGMVFSSDDGPPEKAPGWGVVNIVQLSDPHGSMVLQGWDHYCFHGTKDAAWWGHDHVGLLDCLALPGVSIVMHGRTVDRETYRRLRKRADADPDFPRMESIAELSSP